MPETFFWPTPAIDKNEYDSEKKLECIGENLVITREKNRSKDYVCAGLFSILDKIAIGVWYISEMKHQSQENTACTPESGI